MRVSVKLFATVVMMSAWMALPSSTSAETLNGALSQTLARNPSLASARSNYQANYKSQFVTFAKLLPEVTAFATEVRSDTDAKNATTRALGGISSPSFAGFDTDIIDTDSYGVTLTQDVFTSGKNLNDFRSKRAEVRAAEAELLGIEQNILLSAISAYLDVLQAQSVQELQDKNVSVLEKQLVSVQDRFEVGVVTRTDVAQSQASVAGARAAQLRAQSDLRAARAVYEEVVGIEASQLTTPEKLPRLPRTLERATSIARKESPVLKSAQEMASSGRFTTLSTIGDALPSVRLTGNYTRLENPNGVPGVDIDSTSVQLRLNVPLFRGGRSLVAVAASNDVSNALTSNVHVASNTVERSVIVAWNTFSATKSAIESLREQIKAAELALDGVRQENTLGTRTILEVLDAERLLLDARVALVQGERNQYIAAYSLLATMGRLTAKRLRIEPAEIAAIK